MLYLFQNPGQATHLLSLLYLQLHAHAQAPQGVLKSLPQGFLHEDLMEGSHHTTTREHHCIGQKLQKHSGQTFRYQRKSFHALGNVQMFSVLFLPCCTN